MDVGDSVSRLHVLTGNTGVLIRSSDLVLVSSNNVTIVEILCQDHMSRQICRDSCAPGRTHEYYMHDCIIIIIEILILCTANNLRTLGNQPRLSANHACIIMY